MFERLPSPAELLARPITTALALAAIMTTVLTSTGNSIDALVMTPDAIGAEPWRLLTSALPHIGIFHLVFNVYWLLVIGGAIEVRAGARVIAPLLLATAVGSAALEHAIFAGGVGLSGVGYGLFGFAWAANRRDDTFRDVVDAATVQVFVVWFFVCCVTTLLDVMAVANVAHAGGWAMGTLAGAAWSGWQKRALWAGSALALLLASVALASAPVRAIVNVSGVERDLATEAYSRIESEPPRAIALYEQAIARDDGVANWHYNLGVALDRAQREDDAIRSFERAYELEPDEPSHRDALASQVAYRGIRALDERRWEVAIDGLARALEIAPRHEDAPAWRSNLEYARTARGMPLASEEP